MTRRTPFNGTSAARRRERLKMAAIERGVEAREEAVSSEVLHRPTPSRVVLQCKRQVTPSVNRAVDTETEYHRQILAGAAKYVGGEVQDGMCLPEIAIYNAGYRTVRKGATHIVK